MLAAAGLVAATVLISPAQAGLAAETAASKPGDSAPLNTEELAQDAEPQGASLALDRAAADKETYAGAYFDSARTLHVLVTAGRSPAARAAITQGTDVSRIVVDTAAVSEASLDDAVLELNRHRDEFKAAGAEIGRVGVRPAKNSVALETYGSVAAAETLARSIVSDKVPLTVQAGDRPNSGHDHDFASRISDAAPHYSGIHLLGYTGTGYADCSSGPGIAIGTTKYIVTAAHCYPLGLTVNNGSVIRQTKGHLSER